MFQGGVSNFPNLPVTLEEAMDPTAELPRFNLGMGFVEDESLAESGRPSSLVWLGWVGQFRSWLFLVGLFGGILVDFFCSKIAVGNT